MPEFVIQEKRVYHYPCPCGDRFEISRQQLKDYEDIATCPSCSLVIRVIYDPVSTPRLPAIVHYSSFFSWNLKIMKKKKRMMRRNQKKMTMMRSLDPATSNSTMPSNPSPSTTQNPLQSQLSLDDTPKSDPLNCGYNIPCID